MSTGARRSKIRLWMVLLLVGVPAEAHAQLVIEDALYGVPYGQALLVEAPGVLENDLFNEEPAEDAGATAELLISVGNGTLICETDPNLELCADGSFTYSPSAGFTGTDSFIYQARVGSEVSQATVTLSACSGGPAAFTCWKEASWLAKAGEMGFGSFQEGFEADADWGATRSPFTAPAVVSQGVLWETNHPDPPASNELMTGPGPARTGLWALFDPEHGYATGTPTLCDVDVPPPDCLFKDGFTGTRLAGESTLYGVGGYFTGSAQPNLSMILDGGTPINLGPVSTGGHQFFGVIETAGITTFRVEETDGKIGQARYVFGDDFTLATGPAPPGHIGGTLEIEPSVTPGRFVLRWSPSCSSGAVDYAIFEGAIGSYYSHAAVLCTDAGGDLVEEITPLPGNSYYLVVPLSPIQEGSYGIDSNGFERPVPPLPADRCVEFQSIGGCG